MQAADLQLARAIDVAATCRITQRRSLMFHFYDGYHFIGMHILWWGFWILFIGIMFGAYEPVRRKRGGKDG